MTELNSPHSVNSTPPRALLPVLQKVKSSYKQWFEFYNLIPKSHRYSLGVRIDTLFVEIIESIAIATFLPKTEKVSYVRIAIRKLDTIKILLMVLWETKSLDNKKYLLLSVGLEEIGRMLGGWNGQLTKSFEKNSG